MTRALFLDRSSGRPDGPLRLVTRELFSDRSFCCPDDPHRPGRVVHSRFLAEHGHSCCFRAANPHTTVINVAEVNTPPPLTQHRFTSLRLRIWLWRWRWPLTVALLLAALGSALHELQPPPAGTVQVVTTVVDLHPGDRIRAEHLRYVQVPTQVAPSSTRLQVNDLIDKTSRAFLPSGSILSTLLVGESLLAPPGTVVAAVRLADKECAALLAPGDHIDLVSNPLDGGPAQTVATDAVVLQSRPSSNDETDSAVIAVAIPQSSVLDVSAAQTLSAFITGP